MPQQDEKPAPLVPPARAESWEDCVPSLSLVGRAFTPPEEFVQGILVPGLTVIAASPKAGKTWLCHEFALSVARGAPALQVIPTRQTEVLCLFLEDSLPRIVRREQSLLGCGGGCPGIIYAPSGTRWTFPRLARYLEAFPQTRILIIDTAERFKQLQPASGTSSGRVYSDDYLFWGKFQSLAMQFNIAIILIHHDRKPMGRGNGNGNLDSVSGTRAITGSADHIWLLGKEEETGIRKLTVLGRDLEEMSLEYERGGDGRFWVIGDRGAGEDPRKQEAICMHAEGVGSREIAERLGVGKSTVNRWLREG